MSGRAPSTPKKVCSDLEWRDEVDADERMKRKTASRRDSTAAKNNKRAKKGASSSDAAAAPAAQNGKRKHEGKRARGRPKVTASAKQSVKRAREQRRLRQAAEARRAEEEEARERARKCALALDDHVGNVVAAAEADFDAGDGLAAPEDFFWEVEAVIGRRIRNGRAEYLIRWKGCSEADNTWEPSANLCDTAMEEAAAYNTAQKFKEKQREEDEKKLFGASDGSTNGSTNAKDDSGGDVSMKDRADVIVLDDEPKAINAGKPNGSKDDNMDVDPDTPDVVDDQRWKWSDADQVVFREVERIDVNDPNSAKIVKEARINGTPLVLVGHVGWANFAKRWLSEKKKSVARKDNVHASKGDSEAGNEAGNEGGEAKPGAVDASTVAFDVAVAKLDESKPMQEGQPKSQINSNQKGARKKANKAPSRDSYSSTDDLLDLSKQNYELDVKKMIKDIGGEDVPVIKRNYNEEKPIHGKIAAEKFLRTCWPTSEPALQQQEETTKSQKNSSKLYLHQWQFPLSDTAGRKMCHQNNPLPKGIMGEDLLKYWLDLPQCKLDSPLQYIFMGREDTLSKLHKDPGGLAISIAPIVGQKECVLVHRSDGSNCLYHLNASLENVDLQRYPLLTQARAWRTVVEPGEILLMPYGTYHQCRNVTPCLSYSRFHLDTVNLLPFVQSLINGDAPEIDHEEVLWNLTSELINRLDGVFDQVQSRVKAGLDEGELITGDIVETVDILRTLRHFVRELARREEIRKIVKGPGQESEARKEEHDFGTLVADVDMCLHEFRFRQSKKIPELKARKGKLIKNTLTGSSGKGAIRRDLSKFVVGSKPVVAFNTSLENNYMSLVNADIDKHFPHASRDKVGEALIKELVAGDKISVKLEQKHVKAEVIDILPPIKAAYLSFEDYPSVYDEWQPHELLRLPTGAEIPTEDMKPGLVVIDLSNPNEYRAKIQSTMNGPMARVRLFVSQHEMIRLVSPAMILGRYVPRKRKSKHAKAESTTTPAVAEEVAPPVLRPSKVGQIVKVGRRGAARVIKVHGEPKPTHVDVEFIIGNAHSGSMLPLDSVELAPELDPDSGRGQRQVKKSKKYDSPDEDEAVDKGEDSSTTRKAPTEGLVSPSSIGSSEI